MYNYIIYYKLKSICYQNIDYSRKIKKMIKLCIKTEILIKASASLRFIKNIVRYINHYIDIFKRILVMALFFVFLLWITIIVLSLLTLHEVLKKYIVWIVEDYLSKREEKSKKSKR